ncbi:MAG: redoxin domain-containing protein [Verrucomicrobiota bacterium]|nr:redoxin domain-containing protein [Verrucomicrobiota bacterium]
MSDIKTVSIGREVPNFEVEVYNPAEREFSTISLNQLKQAKKWTILVFYPADFTFVCPTELADLGEQYDALKALGAEVISVSTDTKYAHMAWRDSEKLLANVRYLMAADPTRALSQLFGVYDINSGLALRGTFIINPEGVLISTEINYFNVGRNADELVRKLEANVYLMSHPDEACPAKWTKGGKTLRPSSKMVGKVFEAMQ